MTKHELQAIAEFDEAWTNESKIWLTHRDRNVATDAAFAQHARLKPLIDALIEDRFALRDALEIIRDEQGDSDAAVALAASDARLLKLGGEEEINIPMAVNLTGEACPKCGSTEFMVARDMIGTRHCVRCHSTWEPKRKGEGK